MKKIKEGNVLQMKIFRGSIKIINLTIQVIKII